MVFTGSLTRYLNMEGPGDDQMPLNDYHCECGNTLTIWRVAHEQDKVLCPLCGCNMDRTWTTVEHRFRGPGFYETDYKQKPKDTDD